MSEEEIINNIKKQIENTKKANECGLATKGEFKEDIEALEGLLDLYNKEKEKNIPLIIDGKSINAYADEIEDLLSIEDGTPVYFSIGEKQAIKIISQYCRNSIPKDKIREKIKEYDGLKEMDLQAYEEQIKPLLELLEEE